jgi:hypothetical protein
MAGQTLCVAPCGLPRRVDDQDQDRADKSMLPTRRRCMTHP